MPIYFIYRNSSETEVVFRDMKLIGKNADTFICRLGRSSKILKSKDISTEILKEEENVLPGTLGLFLCLMEFEMVVQGILRVCQVKLHTFRNQKMLIWIYSNNLQTLVFHCNKIAQNLVCVLLFLYFYVR